MLVVEVVLVVVAEEVALVVVVEDAVLDVDVVRVVEDTKRVVEIVVVVVVVSVIALLLMLKSSLMFAPVNDTVFVIEPKPEPEAVTVIVPEGPIGNA